MAHDLNLTRYYVELTLGGLLQVRSCLVSSESASEGVTLPDRYVPPWELFSTRCGAMEQLDLLAADIGAQKCPT